MNLNHQFESLLPDDPLLILEVVAHNADGTSTVEFPNATQLRVRGQGVAVGGFAFVKGGEIRGTAPAVSIIDLEV